MQTLRENTVQAVQAARDVLDAHNVKDTTPSILMASQDCKCHLHTTVSLVAHRYCSLHQEKGKSQEPTAKLQRAREARETASIATDLSLVLARHIARMRHPTCQNEDGISRF